MEGIANHKFFDIGAEIISIWWQWPWSMATTLREGPSGVDLSSLIIRVRTNHDNCFNIILFYQIIRTVLPSTGRTFPHYLLVTQLIIRKLTLPYFLGLNNLYDVVFN